MRIVQVTPWFAPHLGGVESHVMSLSRELVARGHDVRVSTTKHDPAIPAIAEVHGIQVVRVKPRAILVRTPIAPRIMGAVLGTRTEFVHAHSPPPLSAHYASRAAKAGGLPFVVTYHCDIELPSLAGPLLEGLYRRTIGATTLRRGGRGILTTRAHAATSRAAGGGNPAGIPQPVGHPPFPPAAHA